MSFLLLCIYVFLIPGMWINSRIEWVVRKLFKVQWKGSDFLTSFYFWTAVAGWLVFWLNLHLTIQIRWH